MGNNSELKSLSSDNKEYKIGILSILFCQIWWGLCPVYWQALEPIESWKIIIYRIFTMFVYSYIVARTQYSRAEIFGPLKEKSVRRLYFFAGLVLTANWSIYIWAMVSERVIQSAIGYYIQPIVVCVVGIIFFKEKLTKYNITAMVLASIAIVIMLIHYRQVPGVALSLAGTWALYSAIKKASDKPVLLTLVYETMIYAAIALIAIVYIEAKGIGVLSMHLPGKFALLLLSGLVTLIPVGLFGVSAKRVPLLAIGMLGYISPTITLLLGIFVFKEPIDTTQIISFVIIWIGLVFFSYGEYKRSKEQLPTDHS